MNLNNLKKIQLHGGTLVTSGGHLAIHTQARAYGFARPPSIEESTAFTPETANSPDPAQREFIESDPANLPASRAILSLAALDHATAKLAADPALSNVGRTEALKAPRIDTIKTISKAGADLLPIGEAAHKSASEFYAPLKLPAGDTQAASEDREMRDHWKSSPLPKRTVLLGEMQNGQHERLLGALTRSPIALEKHEASLVQSAWIDTVTKRDPKRAATVQSALDSHDWATSVVKDSAKYATRSSGLSPIEINQAAQDLDAMRLFSGPGTIPASVPGQTDAPRAVPV
jgi:hypothetical protein